ncbi:hypothetical protein KC19_4G267900 [Ceratodon purpureus]|uniref:LysM domain-containing protein n=1 Tax=Ceratodon purpureus TaxID=3225 RepID=A0A8T0IFF5_CERPU|nr:hypothetical protein KC19_4G267900 [Ceratodon purpureus]
MSQLGQCRLLMRPWLSRNVSSLQWLVLVLLQCTIVNLVLDMADAVCVPQSGCEAAYAYYRAQANETLDSVGAKFQITSDEILAANPAISTHSTIVVDQPLYIPFKCECMQDQLLHMFQYQVQRADSIERIANTVFEDLTQTSWIGTWNKLPDINFILSGDTFKIPVKCFCGDPNVSLSYGLFLTYVVVAGAGANLSRLALEFNTSEGLLMGYNPSVNWNGSTVDQYAFIPVKDKSGNYPSYSSGSKPGPDNAEEEITTAGVLAGVALGVGGALVFLSLLALCRHCVTEEQRSRQQKEHIANKLKDMEENPLCNCKTGYNGGWLSHCSGIQPHR